MEGIVRCLKEKLNGFEPELGMVLGSGLGFLADRVIAEAIRIPYGDIDGFPQSTVEGHAGCLVCGTFAGKRVLCMQGRFHHYEGYSLKEVTLPIRCMAALGVEALIVTNAAGGISTSLSPGRLMLISDHINMIGSNPLIGPVTAGGIRFPDMSFAYCPEWRKALRDRLSEMNEEGLAEGVYLAVSGPSFETPAEIRAFARLGADAVGMSTVPEVIVARACGLRVLGISCITNAAAGLGEGELSHEDVTETSEKVEATFCSVIQTAAAVMPA